MMVSTKSRFLGKCREARYVNPHGGGKILLTTKKKGVHKQRFLPRLPTGLSGQPARPTCAAGLAPVCICTNICCGCDGASGLILGRQTLKSLPQLFPAKDGPPHTRLSPLHACWRCCASVSEPEQPEDCVLALPAAMIVRHPVAPALSTAHGACDGDWVRP